MTIGDTIVRVWSINPPQCIGNLIGHNDIVRSIQVYHLKIYKSYNFKSGVIKVIEYYQEVMIVQLKFGNIIITLIMKINGNVLLFL